MVNFFGRITLQTYILLTEKQCRNVSIVLTTQNYGVEIEWSLSETCSSEYTYDDYYDYTGYDDYQDYVRYCCLLDGVYNLVCRDHASDGWKGGYLTIDGRKFCGHWEDGDDTIETSVTIGGTKLASIE